MEIITTRFDDIIKQNSDIIKQMVRLYLMFCQPTYMPDGTTDLKYHWTNARAAKIYGDCAKLLILNYEKLYGQNSRT